MPYSCNACSYNINFPWIQFLFVIPQLGAILHCCPDDDARPTDGGRQPDRHRATSTGGDHSLQGAEDGQGGGQGQKVTIAQFKGMPTSVTKDQKTMIPLFCLSILIGLVPACLCFYLMPLYRLSFFRSGTRLSTSPRPPSSRESSRSAG